MFRDLKEYQELQKLYESEVSKPEQLDEFTGLGVKKAVQMSKPKPTLTQKDQSDIKKEAGLQKALANKKNLQKIETKAAADKKEVDFRLKNTESSEQSAKAEARPKRRPVPSPMEAGMGSGAARARAMAKARIAAKKANPNQNQLSGKERAQAMAKARIAAKNKASQPKPETKSGSGVSFGDAIKLNTPKPKGTVLNTQGTDNTKQQATATPTKTKPTYQSNRDKLNRSRQNQRQNQKSNPTTGKIIPKPNTGTDTQGTRKEIPQRNTGTDTQGTRKQIPQRNTGTDTETKTNTQIKKFPGSGKEIDPRAKVTQTTSTNDKGQKVTTTKTNLNLKGSEASDKIKEFKRKQQERRDNVNSMKEAYASIYNQPVESENLDEGVGALVSGVGAGKALGAAMAGVGAGGMLMQKIRRTKSKLNPDPDAGLGGDPEVGKVTTYTKNKKTGKYTKTTKRDEAGEDSAFRNYRDPSGDPRMGELMKDRVQSDVGPIKKTKKGYSILKKRREAAYDKKMERGAARQRYQEIQQAAKPIKNVGTKNIQQDHYEYEPYDIVLEYLLSSEQAATIEEANYIMTEMDAETIQGIVSEGLPQIITGVKALKKSGIGGVKKGVKKVIKKLKGGEMKGDFPSKGGGPYTA